MCVAAITFVAQLSRTNWLQAAEVTMLNFFADKARDRRTGEIVALKKILMNREKDGKFSSIELFKCSRLLHIGQRRMLAACRHSCHRNTRASRVTDLPASQRGAASKSGDRQQIRQVTMQLYCILQPCVGSHDPAPRVPSRHSWVGTDEENACSVFMVFEYCAHDLGRLLDTMTRPFTEAEVKCLVKQASSFTRIFQ